MGTHARFLQRSNTKWFQTVPNGSGLKGLKSAIFGDFSPVLQSGPAK
jgi:hypothetical protein